MTFASDTWGINGSSFLVGYVALCVLVGLAVWVRWRRLLESHASAPDGSQLDVYELAMLNGGPQLTITAAAAKLHQERVLRPGEHRRTVVVDGRLDRDAGELERLVFETVWREPGISSRSLRRHLSGSEPLRRIAARLTDSGLLLDAGTGRRLRLLALWGLPLMALGIARLVAGTNNHKPVGYLAVLVVALAGASIWLALKRPRLTDDGEALLERQRSDRSGLRTAAEEAEVPLALALFGGGALWEADPALAAAWAVPRESARGYYGDGSPGCGGGGCGGGGCGG